MPENLPITVKGHARPRARDAYECRRSCEAHIVKPRAASGEGPGPDRSSRALTAPAAGYNIGADAPVAPLNTSIAASLKWIVLGSLVLRSGSESSRRSQSI